MDKAKLAVDWTLDRRQALRGAAGVSVAAVAASSAGCVRHTVRSNMVVPSLSPIDASRPILRYRPVQGRARGAGGVLAALQDLKRLKGVDGYVELTIEQIADGDQLTTTVTAYPFTYGSQPRPISLRVGPETFGESAPSRDDSRTASSCQASCSPAAPSTPAGPVASVAERLAARRCQRKCADKSTASSSG
ncbi:MAG TPA: hypothetical protein VJT73_07675 [Polyangiaceae bacterium]|nr:hypothetical protein [Polyangiaceae bacterium]